MQNIVQEVDDNQARILLEICFFFLTLWKSFKIFLKYLKQNYVLLEIFENSNPCSVSSKMIKNLKQDHLEIFHQEILSIPLPLKFPSQTLLRAAKYLDFNFTHSNRPHPLGKSLNTIPNKKIINKNIFPTVIYCTLAKVKEKQISFASISSLVIPYRL